MKIVCIGRNYIEHVNELNHEIPDEPVVFIKPDTALLRNNSPFFIPDFSNDIHYEVEVVVKINKSGRHIPLEFAKDYYSELSLGIDFTARDIQSMLKSKGLPWEKAKGFDHSAAIGVFIPLHSLLNQDLQMNDVDPKNQVSGSMDRKIGIQNIPFSLKKNSQLVQSGNTNQMIHSVDAIIAHVSQYFGLRIGDYIFTGTPAGVGPVKKNDRLQGYLAGIEMFNFDVR